MAYRWIRSEQDREELGVAGSASDDANDNDVILWKPAPAEIELIEHSHRSLRSKVRRTDTGETMWAADGHLGDRYDVGSSSE